jgi:hypothetical protein
MKSIVRIVCLAAGIGAVCRLQAQDVIRGAYTYTYGDRETLVDARAACKDLAVRDAIESYYLFVESSTRVENNVTKDDLIRSLAAAEVKNLRVTDQKEEGRTITMTVEAEVNPDSVRALVLRKAGTGESAPAAAADTSAPGAPGQEDFAVLMSRYENRFRPAQGDLDGNRSESATARLQALETLLREVQNRARGPFETRLVSALQLQRRILLDSQKIERSRSRNRGHAERMAARALLRDAKALEAVVASMEAIPNLTAKQQAIGRAWSTRCRALIARIEKRYQ